MFLILTLNQGETIALNVDWIAAFAEDGDGCTVYCGAGEGGNCDAWRVKESFDELLSQLRSGKAS